MVRNSETLKLLADYLKGRVLILGIGNILRGDDGFGALVADELKDKISFSVWNCSTAIENYLYKIMDYSFDTIVLVDAIDSGAVPGELNLFLPDDISLSHSFSTHDGSLRLAIKYLQENLSADIIMIGVQPKQCQLGEGLSPVVSRAKEELVAWFLSGYSRERECNNV